MNTPYKKEWDSNGSVTNPIVGRLTTKFPNRRSRREQIKSLTSGQKPNKLIIAKLGPTMFLKYITVSQYIPGGINKDGEYLKAKTIVRTQLK